MPPKPIMSLADVEELKAKGWTQSEIARHYGVTRQYISWIKRYYGGKLTPREIAGEEFPFLVNSEQVQASPYKRLRDHGEYMATGGLGMSEDKLKRLRSFYRRLREENAVVEFDPDLPPEPGVSSTGGWAYRPREASDGDLLIRVNEYSHLTEAGYMIWRFPPRDP